MVSNERAADHNCSVCSSKLLRTSSTAQTSLQREALIFEKMVAGKRRVARHANLYQIGQPLGMLYLVRFGQFKLIGGELNEQRVARFHMAGDLMGMDGIATGQHNFRAIALESSEVYEIPFAAIVKTMSSEPALQGHFLRTMGHAINAEYSQACLLATTSLDGRFARFLLQLGERYSRLGYSDRSYQLSMSRGDIGSYLGTTNESISRLIARFNAQGAVSIGGRMVELHDRAYLQSLLSCD